MINGFARTRLAPKTNQYSDPRWLTQQQAGMQAQFGQQGNTATENYLARALAFDPTQAINTYAQGAWGAAQSGMKDQLADMAGSAAGGRINTGFFDADRGDVYRRTVSDFGNTMAQTAVQGAQMAMQNNNQMGQFGQEQQNRYTDLLMSRRQEIENAAREEAERKRKKKGMFTSLLGSGLGMLAGSVIPGVGTAIGGAIGKKAAGWFGG